MTCLKISRAHLVFLEVDWASLGPLRASLNPVLGRLGPVLSCLEPDRKLSGFARFPRSSELTPIWLFRDGCPLQTSCTPCTHMPRSLNRAGM